MQNLHKLIKQGAFTLPFLCTRHVDSDGALVTFSMACGWTDTRSSRISQCVDFSPLSTDLHLLKIFNLTDRIHGSVFSKRSVENEQNQQAKLNIL